MVFLFRSADAEPFVDKLPAPAGNAFGGHDVRP